MALISLAYVSVEAREMTQDDLVDILNTARERNPKEGVTGMLLYRQGYFIQALEGEEEPVMNLYNDIAGDERHRNVLMVYKEEITERAFPNWSMGFQNMDELDPKAIDSEGLTDFLQQPMAPEVLTQNPSRAKHLLELFKEGAAF